MSTSQKSLKQQNTLKLAAFITVNAAAFWAVWYGALDIATLEQLAERLLSAQGATAVLLPVVTGILNALLSPTQKAVLVFWRLRDPLPGSRAFTEHAVQDARVDVGALSKRLGELPEEPAAQNTLWYQLYRVHESAVSVQDAHRQFLLTRDMTGLAVLFVIAFVPFLIWSSAAPPVLVIYGIALLAQYILARRAAQNHGVAFVRNVLAEASSGEVSGDT